MQKLLTFLIVSFCMNNIYLQDNLGMINVNVSKQEISNIELAPKYSKNVGNKEGILMHLPNLEGNMSEYRFFKNDFLSQEMLINYPEITTFTGYSVSNKSEFINIVKHGEKINGILMGHSSHHLFEIDNGQYSLKDSQDDQFYQNITGECGTDHTNFRPFLPTGQRSNYLNVKLRKFRLAIVITDEFVLATNGGINAIAAATLIVSNLNAFYKKELAIEFIPNVKPEIPSMPINPSNSAVKGGQVISQYFTLSEYDIGHVFHKITNNQIGSQGQVFGIGTVCNSAGNPPLKASGWTEGNVPISTSFLEVLIHEIAHMFGATHTFNGTASYPLDPSKGCLNNQRSPLTSFEPGAGTTLMSYSGVCGSHNIKLPNNSDAPRSSYFHAGSIDQILAFLASNTNVCGISETLSNSPPLITSITTGLPLPIRLPKSTPFELKGQAIDPDGDNLTYCWEQMDKGPPHGAVNVACGSTMGPIFRSYDPSSNPSRIFPDLQYILKDNNTPASNIGECLPSVSRDELNFRLTVRDNNPQGGGIAFDSVSIMIDGTIGPMAITIPNTLVYWTGGSKRTVRWTVNKTNEICDAINILLSIDGGLSFPFQLADNIPNDGSFEITLPESIPSTSTARIKVESNCSDFVKFFDISNSNFNLSTHCAVVPFNITICEDEELSITEGSTSLNLNFTSAIYKSVKNIVLTTSNVRTLVPMNLISNSSGEGTCTTANNLMWFPKQFPFRVNRTGFYKFIFTQNVAPGNLVNYILSVFKGNYNSISPCDNYIGSSAFDVSGGFFKSDNEVTIFLESCTDYNAVLFSFSSGATRNMIIFGPQNAEVLINEQLLANNELTYLAVNTEDNLINNASKNADFRSLNQGSYKIYGLVYYNNINVPLQSINPQQLIGKNITELRSKDSCYSISHNFKRIKVLALCNKTLEIPDIAGINQLCPGQSTALTASGGVSYIWSTQERTISINVSPEVATTYTVTVTDAEGCSASKNIRVTVNPNPVPVITGTDNICYNTATVLDAGQGYLSYNWSDGGGTDRLSTFDELKSEKTITVTVTDANQCQGTASIDIKVRQPVIPVINGHENLCRGDEVTLYTTLPFAQYSWSNNGGNQSEALYTDVAPGEQYSVTVTDMFGCFGIATVTIDAFTGLNVVLSTENTSCGLDNGSATASIAAQGNYTFQWDTQQTSDHITGLSAGMYTVTVTDNKACSGTATAIISASDVITLNTEVSNTTCGLPNGSARIVAEGGTGFRYLWNDGNVSSFRENMALGSYTVTVTATGDCTTVSEVFIEDSQGLTLSAEVDHTTCGEANGSITIIATGGDSYDYQWNTGDSEPMLIGLPDGDYSVTVTDQRTCFAVIEKSVLPSLPLQVEISGPEAVCEGGTVIISVPEGLSYEWSTGATGSAIHVSPGEYSVTVTDLSGCSTVASKSINTLLVPAPDIQGASSACLNKTIILSVQENEFIIWNTGQTTNSIEVFAGTYFVTVTDFNGCSSIASKTIELLSNPIVVINGANEVCVGNVLPVFATGGSNYRWSTGENTANIFVGQGLYTVTVTDSNGCTASKEITVTNYTSPSISITGVNSVCEGNTTMITANGGVSYKWSNGLATSSISVTSGTYTVTATDTNGCTATNEKKINSHALPTITFTGETNICFNDLTTIIANGGQSYIWNNGSTSSTIQVGLGSYTVTVSDINGCTSSKSLTIQLSTTPSIQTNRISFSAISRNQITLNWENGNGKGRIVVAKSNSPVLGKPNDGTTYTSNTSFGNGSQLFPGEFIVYNGSGSGVTVTNLIENNTYHFRIFEYGCSKNYLTTIANGNPANQIAKCPTPTIQATTITFSFVSTQEFTANWINGNGSRRVVVINTINSFTPPVNGTNPTANTKYSGYGEQVVYNGNGNSVTIKGLKPNQTYWVRIYEANCDGSNSVYNTSFTVHNPISQSTRTVIPSVQSFTASNVILIDNNIIDISPIFSTNKPYDTHPAIDIYVMENNKTRFTLNASNSAGFSFQLVDQLTIVADGNMAINPSLYGRLQPVVQTSHNSMYMDYIHPENVNILPFLRLRLRLLFEGGLLSMNVPLNIHPAQIPLPVDLIDFRAKYIVQDDNNELSWTSKSEINNDYFDVERSFERSPFENIGKVFGAGNSTSAIDYLFKDSNIPSDGNYVYRLKQVDFDGQESFSKLASVLVSRAQSVKTGFFPNPASDLINCFIDAYSGAQVSIEVFNILGQLVTTQSDFEILSDTRMTKQLDCKNFGKGIFNVVFTVDGIRYNHKLIIIE